MHPPSCNFLLDTVKEIALTSTNGPNMRSSLRHKIAHDHRSKTQNGKKIKKSRYSKYPEQFRRYALQLSKSRCLQIFRLSVKEMTWVEEHGVGSDMQTIFPVPIHTCMSWASVMVTPSLRVLSWARAVAASMSAAASGTASTARLKLSATSKSSFANP